jgi:hypothetical protein
MSATYNQIAGQSVERLAALSDSICIINTYWSIAAIVLLQLNYAIAPRFWNRAKPEDD